MSARVSSPPIFVMPYTVPYSHTPVYLPYPPNPHKDTQGMGTFLLRTGFCSLKRLRGAKWGNRKDLTINFIRRNHFRLKNPA
jgi:hypothetical protein